MAVIAELAKRSNPGGTGVKPPVNGKGTEIGIKPAIKALLSGSQLAPPFCLEDGYIEQAAKGSEPVAVFVTIDPAMAARLLARNTGNRPLSKGKVAAYVRDMVEGKFQGMNGETIIVSRDGVLINGQHRLHAVIASGEPLRTLVVFGVEYATGDTVDMGKVRRLPDILGRKGYPSSKIFAAVANIAEAYDAGSLRGQNSGEAPTIHGNARVYSKSVTPPVLVEYAEANRDMISWAVDTVKSDNTTELGGRARLAAACFIIGRANKDDLDAVASFFNMVRSGKENGVTLPAGPIQALRAKLKSFKDDGVKPSHFATLLFILKAWDAHVHGETPKHFKWSNELPPVAKLGA